LEQISLSGAPPSAEPTGRGERQHTSAAQAEQAARAAAKRETLAAKQAEAKARMGPPR
jgi:hypothetical protein